MRPRAATSSTSHNGVAPSSATSRHQNGEILQHDSALLPPWQRGLPLHRHVATPPPPRRSPPPHIYLAGVRPPRLANPPHSRRVAGVSGFDRWHVGTSGCGVHGARSNLYDGGSALARAMATTAHPGGFFDGDKMAATTARAVCRELFFSFFPQFICSGRRCYRLPLQYHFHPVGVSHCCCGLCFSYSDVAVGCHLRCYKPFLL